MIKSLWFLLSQQDTNRTYQDILDVQIAYDINPFVDETPLQYNDSHQKGTFTCETNADNFKAIAQKYHI